MTAVCGRSPMPVPAAIVLGIAMLGGGTVGLAPGDDVAATTPASEAAGSGHPQAPTPDPAGLPGVIGLGGLAALLVLAKRRGRGLSPSDGLGLLPAADPVFVFVPGHGQPEGEVAFSELIDLMDLDGDSVRQFDYRWVSGGAFHEQASRAVSVDAAATALNSFVAGVATGDREVYLIGFSKGGATVAELIADWDDGRWGPSAAVRGAALLDPPLADGALGWLQSAGRTIGPIPDDGGYHPVHCRFWRIGCEDRRAHLGESSGVAVVVVRNPRAAVTSFADLPDGLRVYDAADGGPGPLGQLLRNPLGLPGRIANAHESVLQDPRVAACLTAEAHNPGTCELPLRGSAPPLPSLRRPAVRPPSGQKVL